MGIGPQTHREIQEVMRTKCKVTCPLLGLKWPGCLPGLGCLGPAAECHSSWPGAALRDTGSPSGKEALGEGRYVTLFP